MMGMLDLFKRKKKVEISAQEMLQPWTDEADSVKPMTEKEYSEHRQAERDRLESLHDLNSMEGIKAIPVPEKKQPHSNQSVTGRLEYYLHHKAYEHEKNGHMDLAIACLWKSNKLKLVSDMTYKKSDYLRLSSLLRGHGAFDLALEEEQKINELFGEWEDDLFADRNLLVRDKTVENADALDTDIIEMGVNGCTCSECAKYQGRWFSLSGKSKKYPKIPDAFFVYGGIHEGCRHTFFPVIDGVNRPSLEYAVQLQGLVESKYTKDIVAFSNRPFVDDRSPEVKQRAEEYMAKIERERILKIEQAERLKEIEAERGREYPRYQWVAKNLPDICPKSFEGYRRMKTMNTKNFQKICAEAEKRGVNLLEK